MLPDAPSEELEQREYYKRTAGNYNALHVTSDDEHGKALSAFIALAEIAGPVGSVLDIGAGTGRAMETLTARWPASKIAGIEPVEALREIGHKRGISRERLIAGDARHLEFEDNSFDYVIETAVLHHIANPAVAVSEMARVAKKGVMISDSNNIGEGGQLVRAIKYVVKSIGLWPALVWAQTGGKMYKTSEGDGVFYSFSAFDCVENLNTKFPMVYYMNTSPTAGFNLYRSASHVMIFATKPHAPAS